MAKTHSDCYIHWANVLIAMATTLYSVESRLVDLSHDHGPDTYMAIPDMPRYSTTIYYQGDMVPGVYAKALNYAVSEHGGTHIDAPAHFSEKGRSLEQIPLEDTIADGIMIDCTAEVEKDPHYLLTLKKVKEWEATHGVIPKESAVVLNFNWSHKFLNSTAYLDPIDALNASTFRFPSVGEEAINFLVDERDIKILALDTMSPDLLNTRYPVHVKLAQVNKLLVENVKGPGRLPFRGFRFFASPVKFVGGTGLQTRVFAIVDEEGCRESGTGSLVLFPRSLAVVLGLCIGLVYQYLS